jgi:hypothetical protein
MKPKSPLTDSKAIEKRKALLEAVLVETKPLFMGSRSLRLMLKPQNRLSQIMDGHRIYSIDEAEALLQQILEKATRQESWANYVRIREDITDLVKDKLSDDWKSEKLIASLEEKIRVSPKDFYEFILVEQAGFGIKPDMDNVRGLFQHGEDMNNFLRELELTDRASKEFQEFWQRYLDNGQEPVGFGFAEIGI